MSRIAFLMLFFIFVASVGFWGIDQYQMQQEDILSEEAGVNEEIEEEFVPEDVSEEVQDYMYGFFEGESEIRTYEGIEVDKLKELLDGSYEMVVVLDGSVLDQSRYNFNGLKLVKVSDYDGEFFYTSKYGMNVSGGFMISKRDFEKAFAGGERLVFAFELN